MKKKKNNNLIIDLYFCKAHFWADGPRTTLPPGHMMEVILKAIPRPKRFNLDQVYYDYYSLFWNFLFSRF